MANDNTGLVRAYVASDGTRQDGTFPPGTCLGGRYGGVGAYAAEMLVRAGVGRLTLLDADRVQPSNINRQLCALHSTVGEEKVRVLEQRFKDINPELGLTVRDEFLEEQSVGALLDSAKFDFIVDAIDTIAPKCALIEEAMKDASGS